MVQEVTPGTMAYLLGSTGCQPVHLGSLPRCLFLGCKRAAECCRQLQASSLCSPESQNRAPPLDFLRVLRIKTPSKIYATILTSCFPGSSLCCSDFTCDRLRRRPALFRQHFVSRWR